MMQLINADHLRFSNIKSATLMLAVAKLDLREYDQRITSRQGSIDYTHQVQVSR